MFSSRSCRRSCSEALYCFPHNRDKLELLFVCDCKSSKPGSRAYHRLVTHPAANMTDVTHAQHLSILEAKGRVPCAHGNYIKDHWSTLGTPATCVGELPSDFERLRLRADSNPSHEAVVFYFKPEGEHAVILHWTQRRAWYCSVCENKSRCRHFWLFRKRLFAREEWDKAWDREDTYDNAAAWTAINNNSNEGEHSLVLPRIDENARRFRREDPPVHLFARDCTCPGRTSDCECRPTLRKCAKIEPCPMIETVCHVRLKDLNVSQM